MNKRGQIFLIAAFVIIGVIVGLASVSNYAVTGDNNPQFYDLSEEIEFETKQVIDYGVYSKAEFNTKVEDFLQDYAQYIAEDAVVFIYGDYGEVRALYFKSDENIGKISVNFGNGAPTDIDLDNSKVIKSARVASDPEGNIIVFLDGVNYQFSLRDGQNFFFILVNDDQNERFVAVNERLGKKVIIDDEEPGLDILFDDRTPKDDEQVSGKIPVGLITSSAERERFTFLEIDGDLRMWLPFDSIVEADLGSGSQSITLGNGPLYLGGQKWGGAIELDGLNDYIRINDFGEFGEDYSISFWINPDSVSGRSTVLSDAYRKVEFVKNKLVSTSYGWTLQILNGQLVYGVGTGVPSASSSYVLPIEAEGPSLSANQWTHFVLVSKNNGLWEIYKNGEKTNYFISTAGFAESPLRAFQIGANYLEDKTKPNSLNQENLFNGEIDEVIFIQRALTGEEIKYLYNGRRGIFYEEYVNYGTHDLRGYVKDSEGSEARTDIRSVTLNG